MNFTVYIIPVLFIFVFLYAMIKKVKLYDGFAEGVKEAIPLILSIFPYICAVFILTELFEISGISKFVVNFLSPAFEFVGIPKEIVKLVIIKPFSGSGSLALLSEIYGAFGADSYVARCASVCYGSSETIFYIGAIYFSTIKNKKLIAPIVISLVACLCSTIFACLMCKII